MKPPDVRTSTTGETFSMLKKSIFGWKVVRPALMVLLTLKSSWLMRSAYSVFGGTNGTLSDATVMPGSTSAPTTQPCDAELPGHTVYRVVGVICHTVPPPFGGLLLVVPLGPEVPVSAYCAGVPRR